MESGRGRGTATEISVPRRRQRGCVAMDKRRRGEGERRPAAADAPHGRPWGDVAAAAAGISAPSKRPWRCVARDERRGGEGEWSHGDARSTVWDRATPRARSSGRGRYRLSSAGMHSARHSMPQRASLGTGGRRLVMQKRARSRGGGRSANWARTTPQAEQQWPTPLAHLDSSQTCTRTATGREVDGEALRRQGEPRRARRLRNSGGLAYPDRRRHIVSGLAPPRCQD